MDESLLWERSIRRPGYWIGEFHCHPGSGLWREHNLIREGPLMVFPGTAVEIAQDGRERLIADSNHVVFYNQAQPYRRRLLDRRGDHCVYFGLNAETLAELIAQYDPAVHERLDAPYRHCFGPIAPGCYLQHLEIFQAALRAEEPDPLYLFESVLALFDAVLGAAYRVREMRSKPRSPAQRRRHTESVREIQRLVSVRYAEALSLGDIADAVDLSPFHAARLFREQTGSTIHGYRNQIRLAASLRRLGAAGPSLTDLALELGYSSHSHFTAAFHRTFGITPSAARHQLRRFSLKRAHDTRSRPGAQP